MKRLLPFAILGVLFLPLPAAAQRTQSARKYLKHGTQLFEKGRARLDEALWNGEYYVQKVDESQSKASRYQYGEGCARKSRSTLHWESNGEDQRRSAGRSWLEQEYPFADGAANANARGSRTRSHRVQTRKQVRSKNETAPSS